MKATSTLLITLLGIQLAVANPTEQKPDIATLQSQVTELKGTIDSLRRDNAALRLQLEAKPQSTEKERTNKTENVSSFWISDSGKRHSANCRYYKTCKGHDGAPTEGVACKLCGG